MSATSTLKAQQSEETREAILSASLKLFAKHGFTSTSVDDIGRAAGVTKGAVYWHFKSKDDLFSAILARIRDRWQEVIFRPVSARIGARERLELLFDSYQAFFGEAPETCLFLQRVLLEEHDVFSPQVGRVFRQTARFIEKILEQGKASGEFRKDLDSLLTAHQIIGALSGASQQSLANRSLGLNHLIEEVKQSVLARMRP
jgi:AcrR family transcriptional regulator